MLRRSATDTIWADTVAKAASHPMTDDLHCSADNTIYVRNTPLAGASDAQWGAIGVDGRRAGAFKLPTRLRVLDVNGSRVVAVEDTASGAEVVVTFGLARR